MAMPELRISSAGGRVEGFGDYFRLYTRGTVYTDPNGATLAGIGVAIFNSSDDAVLELSEPLGSREGEVLTDEVAGLEAFVRGLQIALRFQLPILFYTSVRFNLHSYLNGKRRAETRKGGELIKRANRLKDRFHRCCVSRSIKKDELLLNLANSAIAQQLPPKKKTEKCCICLDDEVDPAEMREVCGRRHRFCSSCTKTHIESKVGSGRLPKCPDPKCGLALDHEFCKTFLDSEKRGVLDQIAKEKSIPATERVYCPNPRCSYLMSRAEAFETPETRASILEATACRCAKCGSRFCVRCRVMWHYYMSCYSYKTWELRWNAKSEDAELKALVRKEKWRGCPRCSHMVELAHGCNHIYCRCGHEFCYACGKQWRDKKPTCFCPLWHQANIIIPRLNRQ